MSDYILATTASGQIIKIDGPDYSAGTVVATESEDLSNSSFNADGSLFAAPVDGDPGVFVYNTGDWSKVSGPDVIASGFYNSNDAQFSKDGSLLAIVYDNSVNLTVLNTSGWSKESTPSLPDGGTSCDFSPDGSNLAVAFGASPYLKVYDTGAWTEVAGTPTLPAYPNLCRYSPDGAFLAVALDGAPYLVVYDTSDWSTVTLADALPFDGLSLAFSHDGSQLAVTHFSSPYLTVYDTTTWSALSGIAPDAGTARAVVYSSDDSKLVVGRSWPLGVFVFDTSNWSFITFESPFTEVALGLSVSPPPEPTISASLSFEASFAGEVLPNGHIDSSLTFSASFISPENAEGDIAASLGFSTDISGWEVSQYGQVGASLGFRVAATSYQDWLSRLDPIQLQEVYRLVITGAADGVADLEVGKISSWQATNQAGDRSSYLQAVVPAASGLIEDINARQNGALVIQKGYRFSDGSERYEEILRSTFDTLRFDRGPRSFTVMVSGYQSDQPVRSGERTVTGVRSINLTNGKHRVRCDIDLFLQPGMTVKANDVTFEASYINYYVSEVDKFCEIGER